MARKSDRQNGRKTDFEINVEIDILTNTHRGNGSERKGGGQNFTLFIYLKYWHRQWTCVYKLQML